MATCTASPPPPPTTPSSPGRSSTWAAAPSPHGAWAGSEARAAGAGGAPMQALARRARRAPATAPNPPALFPSLPIAPQVGVGGRVRDDRKPQAARCAGSHAAAALQSHRPAAARGGRAVGGRGGGRSRGAQAAGQGWQGCGRRGGGGWRRRRRQEGEAQGAGGARPLQCLNHAHGCVRVCVGWVVRGVVGWDFPCGKQAGGWFQTGPCLAHTLAPHRPPSPQAWAHGR